MIQIAAAQQARTIASPHASWAAATIQRRRAVMVAQCRVVGTVGGADRRGLDRAERAANVGQRQPRQAADVDVVGGIAHQRSIGRGQRVVIRQQRCDVAVDHGRVDRAHAAVARLRSGAAHGRPARPQ